MPLPTVSVRFSGRALRRRRTDAGLSQMDLAIRAGVYFESIGAWERGDRAPQTRMLAALVHALGCGIEDLFEPVTENAPAGGRERSESASGGTRHGAS